MWRQPAGKVWKIQSCKLAKSIEWINEFFRLFRDSFKTLMNFGKSLLETNSKMQKSDQAKVNFGVIFISGWWKNEKINWKKLLNISMTRRLKSCQVCNVWFEWFETCFPLWIFQFGQPKGFSLKSMNSQNLLKRWSDKGKRLFLLAHQLQMLSN